MNLSIENLRTFVSIAETKNFTKTSRLMNMSQSAVSMQMKRLEEEIGRPIFRKEGRSLDLSETGKVLHNHALRILKAHDSACSELNEPDMQGTITIGTSEDYSTLLLPEVLGRFAEIYPHIRVNTYCDSSHILRDKVEEGLLDLAVLFGHFEGGRHVCSERIVWISSKNFVHTENEPVPLALYPDYCACRNAAMDSLNKTGLDYRIAYESPSTSVLKAAVKSGLAIAPVAERIYSEEFKKLGAECDLPELPYIPVSIHVRNKSRVALKLEEYIVEAFRKE
ncbi:LysR substrate-binding domain-containing protein [Limisalsivibrio acetivorans]|uniref:LysR substrate-binding domain-containing protein n=1 Tax=Limisalsivibrio acetivorans TaxID=1304888 RepID=UPI0003B679ED|nr:LysR substrate-binding domain-containing protein [Limisalsivibrio acetivorans]